MRKKLGPALEHSSFLHRPSVYSQLSFILYIPPFHAITQYTWSTQTSKWRNLGSKMKPFPRRESVQGRSVFELLRLKLRAVKWTQESQWRSLHLTNLIGGRFMQRVIDVSPPFNTPKKIYIYRMPVTPLFPWLQVLLCLCDVRAEDKNMWTLRIIATVTGYGSQRMNTNEVICQNPMYCCWYDKHKIFSACYVGMER